MVRGDRGGEKIFRDRGRGTGEWMTNGGGYSSSVVRLLLFRV